MYREYAADRGAALMTGHSAAMASALDTLSTASDRLTDDLRHATDIQALCLIPDGITDEVEVGPIREWIAEDWPMIDTLPQRIPTGIVAHPSIDDRIARFRQLTRTLEDQ